MNPRFGLSETLRKFGECGRRIANKTWYAKHTSRIGTGAKKLACCEKIDVEMWKTKRRLLRISFFGLSDKT